MRAGQGAFRQMIRQQKEDSMVVSSPRAPGERAVFVTSATLEWSAEVCRALRAVVDVQTSAFKSTCPREMRKSIQMVAHKHGIVIANSMTI